MACTQTLSGNILGCYEGNGGIVEVYLGVWSNVTATKDSSAGTITDITMASTTKMYKYELKQDSNSLTSTRNGDAATGSFYVQSDLVINLGHMDATKTKEANEIAKGQLFAVAKYNNGKYVAIGVDRPANVTALTSESGSALGDAEHITITITGRDDVLPYVLTSDAISDLEEAL